MSMASMKQYECFAHGTPMGYLEMEIVRLTDIGAKSYEAMVGALVGPDPEQVNKVREIYNYPVKFDDQEREEKKSCSYI
jgi:hypothetical protein